MGTFSSDWLLYEPGAVDFASAYFLLLDEARAPGAADFRSRLEKALAGDWSEHAAALQQLGAVYAQAKGSLADWHETTAATLALLHPLLVQRHTREPERLVRALGAMHAFFDRSFCELADARFTSSQEQVRRSELQRGRELKQWETLFEHVAFGICVIDEAGRVIEVANAAFMRIYGIDSLFDQDELVRVLAKIIPFAARTGHGSYETKHVRQSTGETFPVQVEAVRMPGPNATPRWGVSVHDLTERKQVDTLRVRSLELETENRQVREASRLKSEFLANMSHELRTPLNSILGFSELLQHGEVGALTEQQSDFVSDIHTSGKHLLHLIDDVLDLAKVEAGKLDFHAEHCDLAQLVAEVIGVLRGVTHAKGVSLNVQVDDAVRAAYLDPGRLKQVLYNYLSNAIKFSASGGEVLLTVDAEGNDEFRIEVTDSGMGIAPDDLKRLFREFEQLDPGTRKVHGGTGLGLALTRHLVEMQGGTVGVRSVVGEGSVFFAVLPRRAIDRLISGQFRLRTIPPSASSDR